MTTIYDLSKSVFGTRNKTTKPSRRALKAMTESLDETCGYEMSYEDCNETNVGGTFELTISACTIGGTIKGFTSSFISAFVVGFCGGLGAKLGGKIGGWVGALVCTAISSLIGWAIATVVNDIFYGPVGGVQKYTLLYFKIPFFSFSYNIDLGEEVGKALGGFGGGAGGVGLGIATASALGALRGCMYGC